MTGILLGVAFFLGIAFGVAALGVVALISVVSIVFAKSIRVVAVLALLAAALGVWRSPEPPMSSIPVADSTAVELVGVVDSYPGSMSIGQQFVVDDMEGVGGRDIAYCVVSMNTRSVERGERIQLSGEVTALNDLPAQSRAALRSRGCSASLETDLVVILDEPSSAQQVLNGIRHRFETVFERAAPGDAGALMTGLLTGDDSALAFESRQAFLATGTTHITAVSGANFAVLIAVASMLSGSTGNRRRLRWIASITALIWFYALLVGLPPSAVRAAMMASLGLLALRFGRRPDFLTLLVLCGAVQLMVRPDDLYSLSFQLSFVATLALVLVFSGWSLHRGRWTIAIVVSAVAAHLATVPVLAYRIGEIPFASVPANIAISLPVMIAFPLVALAGAIGLLSASVGAVLAIPGAVVSGLILDTVDWISASLQGASQMGQLPGTSILTLTFFCWGLVLVMSHDARMMGSRMIGWFGPHFHRVRTVWSLAVTIAIVCLGVMAAAR